MSLDYGQRHRRELTAAALLAERYKVPQQVVEIRGWARGYLTGSALTDSLVPVPKEAYDEASMRTTVVPNRNAVLLNLAAAVASAQGLEWVAYAAHSGDHFIYADCRPLFVSTTQALWCAAELEVRLLAPFLDHSKAEIVVIGCGLGVPFNLTWSCYLGGDRPCGGCGSCIERRKAFEAAGVEDPYCGGP
jgi:7-cyano-7-deazaguanine synthase